MAIEVCVCVSVDVCADGVLISNACACARACVCVTVDARPVCRCEPSQPWLSVGVLVSSCVSLVIKLCGSEMFQLSLRSEWLAKCELHLFWHAGQALHINSFRVGVPVCRPAVPTQAS